MGLSWQHIRRSSRRAETRRHHMNQKHAQVRYTQPISCTSARKTLVTGERITHEFLMRTLELLVKTYLKTCGWTGILHLGYLRIGSGRGESGRARLEQLMKRVVRHADCCLPHRWPPFRRGRRDHGGTTMPGLGAVPPTERGHSTPNKCGAR